MSLREEVHVSGHAAEGRAFCPPFGLPADPGFLALVLDEMPLMAAYVDAECRYRYVNKTYCAAHRRTSDEIVGLHVSEMLGQALFDEVSPLIARTLEGESVRYEREFDMVYGSRRHLSITYVPYRARGTVPGFFVMIEDETDGYEAREARRQAEEALRRQSRVTQTITDNAASCLFLLDDKGRTTYMNPSAANATGFELAETLSGPLHDLLHPDEATPCALAQAIQSGQPLRDHETVMHRRDGTPFPVICHFAPVPQGTLHGGVLEFRDVTEHRVARELQETNRRLNEMNRMKSEFVSTMSHELRTPLNSIIGFTEVLLGEMSGPVNEMQRRQLRLVADAGNDLLRLISEILELSRIEAGKSTLQVSRFSLADCVLSCIASIRPAADKKRLKLVANGLEAAGEIVSDSRRVRQICLNLLSNAVKFTHEGQVEVSAEDTGATVVVRVRDTGPGIGEDRLPLLFQAFSRTGGDPAQEGAGLGLYISRKLAVMLGGTLELESRPAVGTTLTLALPRRYPSTPA